MQECAGAPGGRACVCCFNKYGADRPGVGEVPLLFLLLLFLLQEDQSLLSGCQSLSSTVLSQGD